MPRAGRSTLVAVAVDAAACAGEGGGCRADLSSHEFARRTSLSPRLTVSWRPMSTDFIYLASGSPRRRELLRQIGVSYRLIDTAVDETALEDEAPLAYVSRV